MIKELVKGILVIILAPIVFNIVASIGNIIGSILIGDLTSGRTKLPVFVVSNLIGFVLVNITSFAISSKKRYYIIGQIINLILLIWSMIIENYDWLYYSVVLIGFYYIFKTKSLLKKEI